MRTYDVIIIGSGLAGMALALHLAQDRRIGLVTKRELLDGASSWAQGGIAGVLGDDDSIDDHVQDTLIAGAGLCSRDATEFVVSHSKAAIEWLIQAGVPFSRDEDHPGQFHLTREGGHSRRRIIHADDATGAAVQQTLVERIRTHPHIEVMEQHIAIDLITGRKLGLNENRCYGCYVLDRKSGNIETLGR
jgi:L-aspartate oxidase